VLDRTTLQRASTTTPFSITSDHKPDIITVYGTNNISQVYQFESAGRASVRVAIYGDMGASGGSNTLKRVTDRAINADIQFVYHLGDQSYADDGDVHTYSKIWNSFFNQLKPISSIIPYMTTVGNNDFGCFKCAANELPYARNYTEFRTRFQMPQNSPQPNMFYSWDQGPVHWVSISTESNFPGSPDGGLNSQVEWLHSDLSKANLLENRAVRPWVIVTGHKPFYTSSAEQCKPSGPFGSTKTLQDVFEPIFKQYSVNLFLAGHIHVYERNWPAYMNLAPSKSYIRATDTITIISGAAGSPEGLNPYNTFLPHLPDWTAFRFIGANDTDINNLDREGYGILTVHNSHLLKWEYFRAKDETIVDSITIVR